MDGHAVVGAARLEAVGEPELGLALEPGVRAPAHVLGRRRVDQQLAREREQVGADAALVAPPAVEVRARDDRLGDAGGVEVVERLVVDEDVAPARALLERLDLLDELLVGGQEAVARVPVALDQRAPDEQVAREDRVQRAVGDGAPGDDRQPVQRHALGGHDRGALLLPARLLVGAADQVLGQRLDPARVDLGRRPAPQPRRLDQLGDHHPARLPLDPAARPEREPRAARAEIVAPGGVAQAEVREQPGQDRLVDRLGLGRRVGDLDADLLGRLADLADQVLPLADPQVVQELALGLLAELVDRQLAAALVQVAPEVQVGEEVRVRGRRGGRGPGRPGPAGRRGARGRPGSTARPRSRSPRRCSRAGRPRAPSGPSAGRSAARRACARAASAGARSRRARPAPAAARCRRAPGAGPAGPGTGSPRRRRGRSPPSAGSRRPGSCAGSPGR